MLMIHTDGRTVKVNAYSNDYKPKSGIPIATCATVWNNPDTGEDFMLVVNEALYFGDQLDCSLWNPNQLRAQGLVVNDVPRQFQRDSTHSIIIPSQQLEIPLHLSGIISGFESRKPSLAEWEDSSIQKIELTSMEAWKPASVTFAEKEATISSVRQGIESEFGLPEHLMDVQGPQYENYARQVSSYKTFHDSGGTAEFEPDLAERLISKVRVSASDPEGDGLHQHEETRGLAKLSTAERRSVLTPEALSKRWLIGLDTAKTTLRNTTQAGIRNVIAPGERKLRHRLDHLRFPNLRGRFYSDTMFAQVKSTRGSTCAQVFTDGKGYDTLDGLVAKRNAHEALTRFIQTSGIPQTIVSDNALEETLGEWGNVCRRHRIEQKQIVPYAYWSNLAEHSIREIKTKVRRAMRRRRAPRRLWDYCGEWICAIRRLTASNALDGRTPFENIHGTTPEISPYSLFDWYEPVSYWDPQNQFPFEKKRFGRWLGVAEVSTDVMAFYVLTETGKVVVRKDVWALPQEEMKEPDNIAELSRVDAAIKAKIGDSLKDKEMDSDLLQDHPAPPDDLFEDDDEAIEPAEPDSAREEADDYTPEAFDNYLTAEVLLPHGGVMVKATVKDRKRNPDGNPTGRANSNPLLDTREYEVEFPDGSTDSFTANLIAENILSQVDEEGHSFSILKEIVDHRTNGKALTKDDGFTTDRRGRRHPKQTTQGWELEVEWKDGSTSWIPLKDLKDSNPVEVSEYAVANKIAEEPAFSWWVRHVLRKRDRIIGKVKSRYWSKTHKFGIELPKSVSQALAIDRKTGEDFWRRAIEKEMKNVMPAFQFLDDDKVPDFYKPIVCHMVFDIKMDLTRKARLVAGGHLTEAPKESTYSSVVSRDSVRLVFMIAALNDLDILCADVQNAYLNAPTKEKVYIKHAGPEFGPAREGRPVLIVRALYGLRSSGARWRDHMAASLREGGYKSCLADPDVWMKANVKPNGEKYWEYVVVYVDDVLVISHEPQKAMDYLSTRYTLKEGSVKEPDSYLGAEIKKWHIDGSEDPSKTRWAMSSDIYVKRALADVERELGLVGQKLMTKAPTQLSAGYRPELDTTPELDPARASYYQGLIGILRWMCEIGRIDILFSVALMSRFLANPREGHLEQVFHIFAFLKAHDRSALLFDDTEPNFHESRFRDSDWSEFYPDAKEVIPPNAPEARGKSVTMTAFVDADHAGCRVTRRSHTGILIYVNRAPILWFSKRQNTVETSTFGSEFVAAKVAVEIIEGLRYKLRMMGIEIDGPTNLFCDNDSVVRNSSSPESTLKKKHNSIAYHRVREAQAAGVIRITHEDGLTNLADLFTKALTGPRLKELVQRILW